MKHDSEDEGFQEGKEQIIHIDREHLLVSHRLPAGNELIPKRKSNCVNSIFTSIELQKYPCHLDLPYSQTSYAKTCGDEPFDWQTDGNYQLHDFLFQRRHKFKTVYNKFRQRPDYSTDLTSIYRNLDYHLDYSADNFRLFDTTEAELELPIEFNSNFQSGNLMYVFEMDGIYYLLLHNDVNSHGYTQWFYFRVRNKEPCQIRMRICNILKPPSLFKKGMKVSIFSQKQKELSNRNWFKGGEDIRCYKNDLLKQTKEQLRSYYSVEFKYNFEYADDSTYFCLNIPYTYSRLLKDIDALESATRQPNIVVKKRSLSYTISNNDIQMIEVYNERVSQQKVVIITARQHPCQTVSSWAMLGIMNFLVRDGSIALQLMHQYRFFLIPMVNPDGVVHGNSRLNLQGVDINRQWMEINKGLCYEAFVIASWIQKLKEEFEVGYVIDLHGHSKKCNVFGYFSDTRPQTKAFANTLSQLCRSVKYESCTFGIASDKQKTFRSLVYNLGCTNAITIEHSYFGTDDMQCFTCEDLQNVGVGILKTINKFTSEKSIEQQVNQWIKAQKVRQQQRELMKAVDKESSDSDPECDYLNQQEREEIVRNSKAQGEIDRRTAVKSSQEKREYVVKDVKFIRSSRPMFDITTRKLRKQENNRYSMLRSTTEPQEERNEADGSRMIVRGMSANPVDERDKKVLRSNIITGSTTGIIKGCKQNPITTERKFSSGRMTTYPTTLQPYFSRFNTIDKVTQIKKRLKQSEELKPKLKEVSSEQTKSKSNTMYFRHPNRLIANKLLLKRTERKIHNVRSPNAYMQLKEFINITSYGNT